MFLYVLLVLIFPLYIISITPPISNKPSRSRLMGEGDNENREQRQLIKNQNNPSPTSPFSPDRAKK